MADGAPQPVGLLERYGQVARVLYRLRVVFYAGIVVGLGFFMYAVIFPAGVDAGSPGGGQGSGQESRMLLPLVGVLWCVCLSVFIHGFNVEFPTIADGDGWFRRLQTRAVRGLWHLLAIGVIAFGAGTVVLTFRAFVML